MLQSMKIHSKMTNYILYQMEYTTQREIHINEYEKKFFAEFEDCIRCNVLPLSSFKAERKSDGTIVVKYENIVIGRIHLRKYFGKIQYYTLPAVAHNMVDAPFEAIMTIAPYWASYAKHVIH